MVYCLESHSIHFSFFSLVIAEKDILVNGTECELPKSFTTSAVRSNVWGLWSTGIKLSYPCNVV